MVAARDDNPHADCAQIEQQAEVVQVAVKEGVFVVPLDFERNPIFVAIDLVRWGFQDIFIDFYRGGEFLFNPAPM